MKLKKSLLKSLSEDKKIILALFIILIIITYSLTLFNASKKSTVVERDKILEKILVDNYAADGIQLTSFKVLNSIDKNDLYYIEYRADLYFLYDGRYLNNSSDKWFGEKIQKGQSKRVNRSAVFKKTVNGWQQMSKESF